MLDYFALTYPSVKRPADSTGDLILARTGLVEPRKRKRRTSADTMPFGNCLEANAVWCTDFKGEFALGNKQLCYPLTVTDLFSHHLFACESFSSTRACNVFTVFDRLFSEFGLPWSIRSDNGTPFASMALGGISRLSKWWIDLGIRPQRIKPSHPEQNGQHERMHRSLKAFLLKRPNSVKQTLSEQQAVFDDFRQEYNNIRSHEGLNRQCPAKLYQPSKQQ
ncbi:Integrase core domain [Actinobacillus ureae]|nr:DDE-type integrase/transposase/recombinase [Actinobacillus ureae]SUT87861.1 Integrase core domain [Actinobacillus ureae]SUT87870.1 Integrase core domain [Actinobacillus ureae]SUU49445.1 Integrase core domain [Actinobacillus ureae]SUU49461.1 Integrase core domain [Actinobacillus ureae]